ncbi:hypothetical protein [Bradyrhizobium canariense]|uniref:hypothetical protein n=1 Tax=Bradyrhizobium canariense TaxID=255045 RepID=UPI0011773A80|nr:hypothetical protein [Bradyrhizobium canariense]
MGISAPRVRQIVEREQARQQRAAELVQAAALPEQPNILHLPPRLRAMMARACDKQDFKPQDILDLHYTPAMFMTRLPGFCRRDWRDLDAWLRAAGLSLERPLGTASWQRGRSCLDGLEDTKQRNPESAGSFRRHIG